MRENMVNGGFEVSRSVCRVQILILVLVLVEVIEIVERVVSVMPVQENAV